MISETGKNFKRFLLVVFWIIILFALAFGFSKFFFFVPCNFLGLENARIGLGAAISFLLLIYLGLKYEKMQNEIYKWKNKDKITNQFNEHIFKDNDEK